MNLTFEKQHFKKLNNYKKLTMHKRGFSLKDDREISMLD